MQMIHEGESKAVYSTDMPGVLIQRFKDPAGAVNAGLRPEFSGKGELHNRIASMVFRHLEERGVPSRYLDTVTTQDMRVRQVTELPLIALVRNVVAGSLVERLGLPEATLLASPIVEFHRKVESREERLLNEDHVRALKLATPEELVEMRRQALLVNDALNELFDRCDLKLIDFRLGFGKPVTGELLLADELTPQTMQLWTSNGRKLDQELFRRELGDLVNTSQEIHDRILENFPNLSLGELAKG